MSASTAAGVEGDRDVVVDLLERESAVEARPIDAVAEDESRVHPMRQGLARRVRGCRRSRRRRSPRGRCASIRRTCPRAACLRRMTPPPGRRRGSSASGPGWAAGPWRRRRRGPDDRSPWRSCCRRCGLRRATSARCRAARPGAVRRRSVSADLRRGRCFRPRSGLPRRGRGATACRRRARSPGRSVQRRLLVRPAPCGVGGGVECGERGVVRAGRRQREVTGLELRLGLDRGERPVHRAAAPRGRVGVHAAGQQRMGEPDPVAVDVDDAVGLDVLQQSTMRSAVVSLTRASRSTVGAATDATASSTLRTSPSSRPIRSRTSSASVRGSAGSGCIGLPSIARASSSA